MYPSSQPHQPLGDLNIEGEIIEYLGERSPALPSDIDSFLNLLLSISKRIVSEVLTDEPKAS